MAMQMGDSLAELMRMFQQSAAIQEPTWNPLAVTPMAPAVSAPPPPPPPGRDQLPAWAQGYSNVLHDGGPVWTQQDRGDTIESNPMLGAGFYSGLPDWVFDVRNNGEGDIIRTANPQRLQEFLGQNQLREAYGDGSIARWMQDSAGNVTGPVDVVRSEDPQFTAAALAAMAVTGANIAAAAGGLGGSAAAAAPSGISTGGSGLTAGTGGTGLSMGTGGTGLTAAPGAGLTLAAPTGTGAGLSALPGAGLTLAAPTGTGAGLALGTGADIIGAGIGSSIPTGSMVSDAVRAMVPPTPATGSPAGSPASQQPSPTPGLGLPSGTDLLGRLLSNPQALTALLGGLLGGASGPSGGGEAAPVGPPVQWTSGLQMGIQPTARRAQPSALPRSPMSSGAGRFV